METRRFEYKGMSISYNYYQGGKDCIILLHGYSFNSKVWDEVGLTQALVSLGLSVIALDVPGFPQSLNKLVMNESELVSLIGAFAKGIEGRTFLLGASASAHAVLKFAEEKGSAVCGIIVVGPASVKGIAPDKIKARVLAVWGEEDDVAPAYKSEDAIRAIKGSKMSIIKGAKHACYLNQPKTFIKMVSDFISSI